AAEEEKGEKEIAYRCQPRFFYAGVFQRNQDLRCDPDCPPGRGDGLGIPHLYGDKFLSIPCEKSGNVLRITHPP
ncbi:MAG TPA: hypothetical protein ACFYD4_14165, partial [Candidatus Wunengus sp. YC61]|uniref:hypothetical protein n=1 Tax=Candidatus Wunengus sp. YC61 TaxID=3367698 RepID=UPI00402890C9